MKNEYRIEGDVVRLNLTQGKETRINSKNLAIVAGYRWYAHKVRRTFYAATMVCKNGKRSLIHLHQLLRGKGADHKDRDGLNNLEENLRPASLHQQNRNRGIQSNNSSGFKGVSWDASRGKWFATIFLGGKNRNLGRFTSKEEAARAYDAAALEHFGEFAVLNFPNLTV